MERKPPGMDALELWPSYIMTIAVAVTLLLFLQPGVILFMERAIPSSNCRSLTLVIVVAAVVFLLCGLLKVKDPESRPVKRDVPDYGGK